jgi:phosphoribosylformylglycinamidine synthase
MTDDEVKKVLQENKVGLTVGEARKVEEILGRAPTITEAVVWGIQGSEHCSYKSSRRFLKQLPTDAPNVILGPVEDAGVVEIVRDGKDRWGLVMSHESHNHPSQVVPYEGAATGIGGNVRDVACMGARVIGVLDPLRFGEPEVNECRVIANEVVQGIAGYGNPIGVPNLGGDINFGDSFNDNCLVNVLTLGLVREQDIIHSYCPAEAAEVGYDIILVGKPTDNSGMGGAAFASLELDEEDKEANKGAVQEPNPFLKRHLLASTYDLFDRLKAMGKLDKVGFKDMGAGGNVCSTVEQVVKRGFGAKIDIGEIHVGMDGLHPSVIAASETQERFAWTCHPELTQMILEHYNTKWDLGTVAHNAKASLVGKVTAGGRYVMTFNGETVIDARAEDICEGLRYERDLKAKKYDLSEPDIDESSLDLNKLFVQLIGSKNICSRKAVYKKYDKNVQGNTIIEAGEGDAGMIAPLLDNPEVSSEVQHVGVAVSTDGISRYSQISPYWQAANAVVETLRNIAAVGATPAALTDCLNYNNPEIPEQMWEFSEGVRGIADACRAIPLKNYPESPTPIISGNVSLYNSVDVSAIIGGAGVIQDFNKAVTFHLKKPGNLLFLLGDRKNELGGSEFYHLLDYLGAKVPQADFEQAKNQIYSVIDGIDQGLIQSCHDISEGGLLVSLAEMTMSHPRKPWGDLGVKLDLSTVGSGMPFYQKAFSETGGFVVEISPEDAPAFSELCQTHDLQPIALGQVSENKTFTVTNENVTVISLPLSVLQKAWMDSLSGVLK